MYSRILTVPCAVCYCSHLDLIEYCNFIKLVYNVLNFVQQIFPWVLQFDAVCLRM